MTISLKELYNSQLKKYANTPQIGIPWNINARWVTKFENPMCGDKIEIRVEPKIPVKNEFKIGRIFYECKGCALCLASSYILAELVKKCDEAYFYCLYNSLKEIINPKIESPHIENIKLSYFRGTREYPQRIKCVMLPWEATKKGIEEEKRAWGK